MPGQKRDGHPDVLPAMPLDPEETATIVTSRAIRAGHEEDFERWAAELDRLARAEPGFRASIRLGQTAGFQHLLFRFDDRGTAEAWRNSPAFVAHAAMADDYSTALDQIGTGDAVRFELPSDASASKWKRFVTTWLTVFPVLLIVSLNVRMVVKEAPLPLQLLPSSLLLTATLQWVILPRLQRHTRFWLLQDGSGHLRT
ncbi:antibiotic biosynthesis monooxygenase (ABM) superfamily enzyme [Sphingomonas sp. SORGH_AS 950]|uniref:antibiotic biosynthesis monooxygenase n=1 Tax=Sphingomonas sp. SORGH_AS_0950 TaxID=3041792 RepID=UPI002781C824|nr:antibiotic biosynthesis monooxygenase [Sphingomonas sp. SORGH_AS_0950]MDQ1157367.1 antibiotic biosynthesis monooxygenase (ABM) superfamily enzyme [Sphingomonas sp. SORGH_AS_0950]